MDSIVLERSETLRATGAAIGIQSNGWRALDQLGVGSKLRQTAIPILRFVSRSIIEYCINKAGSVIYDANNFTMHSARYLSILSI